MLNESHLLQATIDMLERDEKDMALSGFSADSLGGFTWSYHAKDKTPQA